MQDAPPARKDVGVFDSQGASARPGGLAQGGVDPKQGDPVSPAQADQANREAAREMRDLGFGDDKGSDIS